MHGAKVIATGLAAILVAACNSAPSIVTVPSAAQPVPVAPTPSEANPPPSQLSDYYVGSVRLAARNFQIGNFIYFGPFFAFNDDSRDRGYFVIDPSQICDQSQIDETLARARSTGQKIAFRASELTTAVLKIEFCPTLVQKATTF